MIGEAGDGFRIAMRRLDNVRVEAAATAVGNAERLLEDALSYASDRTQFGEPIAQFQLIQGMLADSKAEAYAARAPLSVWYAKMAVNTGMQMDLEPALEFERHLTGSLFTTEDRSEGMSAFLEKRDAVFKGK